MDAVAQGRMPLLGTWLLLGWYNMPADGKRLRLSAAGATFQGQDVTPYVDWQRAV